MLASEKMKQLLAELKDTHDLGGFLLRCAEWTAEDLEHFTFKPMPMKPKEAEEYEALTLEEKMYLDESWWKAHPEVGIYYDLARLIKRQNRTTYEWIKEAREILAKDNRDVSKLDQRLKEVVVEQLWTI